MKKILSCLLTILLFTTTIFCSTNSTYAIESVDEINVMYNNENYRIKTLLQNEKMIQFEINNGSTVEKIEVDYSTKNFTITDSNGEQKQYNANDFIINDSQSKKEIAFYEKMHITSANETEEELISQRLQLESDEINTFNFNSSRQYIQGDIMKAIGLNSSSATFKFIGSYNKGPAGMKVNVYKGSQWENSYALKKFNFTKGTALGILTSAILAFIPGVSVGAMNNFLISAGVGIINGHLGDNVTLFVGAKKEDVARAFHVGKGFTTKTKSYYKYVYGNKSNGTAKNQVYSSGGAAWFYNNWSDSRVADVAYQQYRYIERLRSTAPKRTEF